MSIIIGTAGHIDHGKTTLIKHLTGVDTDRLPEEKKRGISIDIGFSYLNLNNERVGIIDVPGHEKFVKNMMAGATGIDIVILVVAADDGIMPQTREHFDIVNLLGIKKGIIALTKTDKVDEKRILEVREELKNELKGTFLGEAEIVETAITKEESYDLVREKLKLLIDEINKGREEEEVFRMAVDRSFSIKGFGTVITGTSQGKELKVGDQIEIYPTGKLAKVRGIQNHGKAVDLIDAGNRCAINLAGIDKKEIKRGDVVATPGTLAVTKLVDARINYLKSNKKELKNNQRVRFHHGTKEVIARVKLLDKEIIEPGEEGLVQLILEKEIVGFIGDLGIIRNYSPMFTIGGIEIINPLGKKTKRFNEKYINNLEVKGEGTKEEEGKLTNLIDEISGEYPTLDTIKVKYGSSKGIEESLKNCISSGSVIELKELNEILYIGKNFLEEKQLQLKKLLEEFHRENPLQVGVNLSTVRNKVFGKKLKNKNYLEILKRLEDEKTIKVQGNLLSLYEFEIKLDPKQGKIRKEILESFDRGGYKPPKYSDLSKEYKGDKEFKMVFDMLVLLGELKFIEKDIFLRKESYDNLVEVVKKIGEGKKLIQLGDLKEEIEASRKFLVAYLEYFDRIGMTKRTDDGRVLI